MNDGSEAQEVPQAGNDDPVLPSAQHPGDFLARLGVDGTEAGQRQFLALLRASLAEADLDQIDAFVGYDFVALAEFPSGGRLAFGPYPGVEGAPAVVRAMRDTLSAQAIETMRVAVLPLIPPQQEP